MSGKLIVKGKKQSLMTAVAAAAAIAAGGVTAGVVMYWVNRYLQTAGLITQVVVVVAALAAAWYCFFTLDEKLASRGEMETLPWTVTETELRLGEKKIERSKIRQVYCWKKKTGWLVNIETSGPNELLRSRGNDEASVESLRALVVALGYGARWQEN